MPRFVLYPVEPVDAPRGTGNFNSTVMVYRCNVLIPVHERSASSGFIGNLLVGVGRLTNLPFIRNPPAARGPGRQFPDTGGVFVGKPFARRDARIENVDPERVDTELFPSGLVDVDEDLALAARQRFVLVTITVGTFVRYVTVNRFPGVLVLETNDLVL